MWRISPAGVVKEMFRVQPMANEVNLVLTPPKTGPVDVQLVDPSQPSWRQV